MSEVDQVRDLLRFHHIYDTVSPAEAQRAADIIIRSSDSGEILWQLNLSEMRLLARTLPEHKKQELLDDLARDLRIETLTPAQRETWHSNFKELGVAFGYQAVAGALGGYGSAQTQLEFKYAYVQGRLENGYADNATLHEITRILGELTPAQRNQLLAGLNDRGLSLWADKIGAAIGGLSGKEKRALFDLLAPSLDHDQWHRLHMALSKEAPEVANNEFIAASLSRTDRADTVTKYVQDLLAGGGPFDDVSRGALRQIYQKLAALDRTERNRVIAGLSEEQLNTWTDEIGGAWGGLSGKEKQQLFDLLAGSLDGTQLTRFGRSVFLKMPEAEGELTRAIVSHADGRTTLDFICNMAAHANADEHTSYSKLPGNTHFTTSYGNAEARIALAALVGLADRVPNGATAGSDSTTLLGEALSSLGHDKLDTLLEVALQRKDSDGNVPGLPQFISSEFKPDQLIRIIDAAARSGDPTIKSMVLESAAKQLQQVEFSDVLLQKVNLVDRPATWQIAAALRRLLDVPAAQSQWIPAADGPKNTGSGYFVEKQPEWMMRHMQHNLPTIHAAAAYYEVDPRAVPLVVYVEAKYNVGCKKTLAVALGGGRGKGFGQLHDSAVRAIHPGWNPHQVDAARMNAEYAPALIAADMDAKARVFEMLTDGKVSIRNDPVMLAWAYNSSLGAVVAVARKAADTLDHGQRVVFDLTHDIDLGDKGMAGYAKLTLEQGMVDVYAARSSLPGSQVPYTVLTA